MKQVDYLEFVKQLNKEMELLVEKKNKDYAQPEDALANFRMSENFGVDPLTGLSIRLGDKFRRLMSFCKNGNLAVKSEPVEDVFKDFIGYSYIALAMLHSQKKGKENVITSQTPRPNNHPSLTGLCPPSYGTGANTKP